MMTVSRRNVVQMLTHKHPAYSAMMEFGNDHFVNNYL
jgi:hypothetical protein